MVDDKNRRFVFFTLSVLLHLVVLLILALRMLSPDETIVPVKSTEISFVDINEFSKRAKTSRELAEQDDQKSLEKPVESRFMGKNNKTVKKETKSANYGQFKNVSRPQAGAKPQARQMPAKPQKTQIKTSGIKTFSHGDFQLHEPAEEATDPFARLRPNGLKKMVQAAQESRQRAPASQNVSQTQDYLKDVEISSETHLNTRRFKYFSYYSRIKRRLSQHWVPLIHHKISQLRHKGRQPASVAGKMTHLIITMDTHGILTRVQLETTSGLKDLDDAAMEAFQKAAPFPNPPTDLIENGYVKINWSFILE